MSEFAIIPVEYGKSYLAESMIFQNGAEDKFQPIVFKIFLIRAGERLILVDAGCVTMPGFEMTDFIGPIKALEQYNVRAEDITDVIITHAHHDHIECINYFKNARIFIQKDEYADGKGYIDENMKVVLFSDEIEVCDGVRAVKIGGHSIGSCVVEVDGDKKYVIIGDECYKRECIEKDIPTGTSYCLEKSKEFLRKYGNGEYKVLTCHDNDNI